MSKISPAPGGDFGEQFVVECHAWEEEEASRPKTDDGEPGTGYSLDDEAISASEAEPTPPSFETFGELSSRELNAVSDAPAVVDAGLGAHAKLLALEVKVFGASDVLSLIMQAARARLSSPFAVLGAVMARVNSETRDASCQYLRVN